MELEPKSFTSSSSTFSSNLSCRGLGAHFEERCALCITRWGLDPQSGLPQTSGVPCCRMFLPYVTATQLPPEPFCGPQPAPHPTDLSSSSLSELSVWRESPQTTKTAGLVNPALFHLRQLPEGVCPLWGHRPNSNVTWINNTDTLGRSDFPEHFSSVRRAVSGVSALSSRCAPRLVLSLF